MRFGFGFSSVMLIAISVLMSYPLYAQSQIDPSSALLLNGASGDAPNTRANEPRLDSGRYTVKPRAEKPVKKSTEASSPQATPTPAIAPAAPAPTAPVTSSAASTVLAPSETGPVVIPDAPPVFVQVPDARKSEAATDEVITHEIQKTPIDDMIEVSIASTYLYASSESGYSFRQWTMNGPAYVIGARAWLNREIGMGGTYLSTMGGQVTDRPTPTTTSSVAVSQTETAFGIFLKKTFDRSKVVFGIEMVDSQFKVASEAISKLKTKSGGLRLSVESEFDSRWRAGFSIMPKIEHEESTAGTNARSGTGVNAYAVGASLEHRWTLDNSNSFFMRLEHRVERDLFTGLATTADPLTGTAPNGVAVTVGTTLIQFGYSWGN